uniref:Putative aspartoacylase n=1 Tax=uncultured bacterium contig00029 TaxID=1181518 RepID=A0A806KBY7_9BACT|nr:putative aspartoacylase [uncultured bacterium contig00029]
MELLNKIVICGGTHGNELIGVYLAKKHGWLIANPAAVALCRRYVDCDLNRCFSLSSLSGKDMRLENLRAREINSLLGGKGTASAPDLILDVHNTTANMGVTLILSSREPALLRISGVIATEFSDVHIYLQPEGRVESPYLGTIARGDVCIEAGPQAHGTLNAELFFKVERIVFRFIELVDAWNKGSLPKANIETFTEKRNVDYPRDLDGNIVAMIHPNFQGKDFCELRAGMPVFMDFYGNDILWEGETCYPAFINEAAYYEKGIAMSLTEKNYLLV